MPLQGNMGTWGRDSHRMDSGTWEGSCLLTSVVDHSAIRSRLTTNEVPGYHPSENELILFLATINERKQGTGNISRNSAGYLLVFELKSVFSHIDQEACTASFPVFGVRAVCRQESLMQLWVLVVSRTRCPGR